MTRQALSEGDKILLGSTTILKFTYQDQLDEAFQRQMSESALRDGLTRAYNKRYLTERIESELQFALRHDTPLSLIFLDIDHFKRINDVHGHQAGDHVLVQLATLAMSILGEDEVFARYGGEEFAVISRGMEIGGGAGAVRTHPRQRRGASVRVRRRDHSGHHQHRCVARARSGDRDVGRPGGARRRGALRGQARQGAIASASRRRAPAAVTKP